MSCVKSQSVPPLKFRRGWGVTLEMFQVYASAFVALTEKLLELEREAENWQQFGPTSESLERMNFTIYHAEEGCQVLDLTSAKKLIARMRERSSEGKIGMTHEEFKTMVVELRTRI